MGWQSLKEIFFFAPKNNFAPKLGRMTILREKIKTSFCFCIAGKKQTWKLGKPRLFFASPVLLDTMFKSSYTLRMMLHLGIRFLWRWENDKGPIGLNITPSFEGGHPLTHPATAYMHVNMVNPTSETMNMKLRVEGSVPPQHFYLSFMWHVQFAKEIFICGLSCPKTIWGSLLSPLYKENYPKSYYDFVLWECVLFHN